MKKAQSIFLFFTIVWVYSCSSLKINTPLLKNKEEKERSFYSEKLGIELKKGFNKILIEELIGWLGVSYKYGGISKQGVDCSGFIMQVYKKVYEIATARSANGLYETFVKVQKNNLKQGELVFFKINTAKVGHVGIYIENDYFVHASSSKGVMVSSLNLNYWEKYFVSGGKIK